MPLSQAQLIAGDSTKGVVLPGRAQGVVAGAGIAISPTGVISSTQPWTVSGNILSPSVIGNAVGIGTTTVKAGFLLQVNGGAVALSPFANLALLEAENGTGYRWTLNNDSNLRLQYTPDGFATGSFPMTITPTGVITFNNLAGTGTRMVVADANGLLSSTAIPAGTVTDVTGTLPIVSSGGATPAISINAATTTTAGSMSSADKTKLDGLSQVWTQAGTNLYTTTLTSDVGIGTATPGAKLGILGTSPVSVGDTSPFHRLNVVSGNTNTLTTSLDRFAVGANWEGVRWRDRKSVV